MTFQPHCREIVDPRPGGAEPCDTRRLGAGLVLASSALTVALYGAALHLPLYHDDVVLTWLINANGLIGLFTDAHLMPYYRPFSLAPWAVIRAVTGAYTPFLIHLLNLALHALNGALVALLAYRLYPHRRAAPWLALVIYIVFPFSYQAVTWASALCHPLVTAAILLAILSADHWWESGRWHALAVTWLAAFWSAFSHENGVLVSPLLVGWLFLRWRLHKPDGHWLAASRRLLLVAGPAALFSLSYAAIWLSLPKTGGGASLALSSVFINMLYFSQGITLPLSQFGGRLVEVGLQPMHSALITASVGLVGLVTLLKHLRDARLYLGLGWFVIGIGPAVAFLDWSAYVIHGPRLMLLPSVGAALLWMGILTGLWESLLGLRRWLPAALTLLLVGGGLWFAASRVQLHSKIAPLYNALIEHATGEGQVLVFNLPAWIAPTARVYPLGDEGVGYMPDYFPFEEMVTANTGKPAQVDVLSWPDKAPLLNGYWVDVVEAPQAGPGEQVSTVQRADRIIVVKSEGTRWGMDIGQPFRGSLPSSRLTFNNGTDLAVSAALDASGQAVEVQFDWRVTVPGEETVFVHLLCENEIVNQSDGPPVGGVYPFSHWKPGEQWHESRWMVVPRNIRSPACLQVRVGLYYAGTGERVPLDSGSEFALVPVDLQ